MLAHEPTELPDAIRELAPAVAGWGPVEQLGEGEARLLGTVEEATERSRRYARHAQEYRYLALHDPVTAVFNRRAFDDRLQELAEGDSTDALIAIDLDRFKAVNDTHAHDAGDELLRAVGKAIGEALRPGDFAARTGETSSPCSCQTARTTWRSRWPSASASASPRRTSSASPRAWVSPTSGARRVR